MAEINPNWEEPPPTKPQAPTTQDTWQSDSAPTKTQTTWQEELSAECRQRNIQAPVYNIFSDRRGGRTAWSATVALQGQDIPARYWYDGQYVNDAKEDAAQVAVGKLRGGMLAGRDNPRR